MPFPLPGVPDNLLPYWHCRDCCPYRRRWHPAPVLYRTCPEGTAAAGTGLWHTGTSLPVSAQKRGCLAVQLFIQIVLKLVKGGGSVPQMALVLDEMTSAGTDSVFAEQVSKHSENTQIAICNLQLHLRIGIVGSQRNGIPVPVWPSSSPKWHFGTPAISS